MFHLLSIVGLAVVTATAAPTPATQGEPASPPMPDGAGLQVVIDPATGLIVDNPTAAQLDRVEEGIDLERRRSAWELREFSLPSGGRGVYLDGWADHALTARITPDGQVHFVCSQGDGHDHGTAATPAGEGDDQ